MPGEVVVRWGIGISPQADAQKTPASSLCSISVDMAAARQTTSLGTIHGKCSDGVTQYLGIKYASLRNRLADAVPVDNNGGTRDATKDG